MRGTGVLAGTAALIGLTTAALAWTAPFRETLAAYTTDLAERSPAQRRNIENAARRLDGLVLEPGEAFSFNRAVGPRTPERGFVAAPAFLEGSRLESVGGGICQVSSTLYSAALLAGLAVEKRVPHDRAVLSVPPGADATVWYGKADLAFRNGLDAPVRIAATLQGERLTIGILGPSGSGPVAVAREELAPPRPGTVRVRTWRIAGARRELISDDVYRHGE